MADTKISGLTTLADADVAADDYLPIADTSTTTTKKVAALAFLPKTQPQNTQSGTTYTFALTDANKLVISSGGSAAEFTVPPNGDVAFPIGTRIDLFQSGGGQLEIAPGSGVTINVISTDTLFLAGQYAEATLTKYATNTWVLTGRLEPA